MHLVVGPYTALVPVRVHSVVHSVDVGTLDITVYVDSVEDFGVREIRTEPTNLPRQTIAFAVLPAQVTHFGINDILAEIGRQRDGDGD